MYVVYWDSISASMRVVRGHQKATCVSTERIYEFHTLKTNHNSHTSLNAFVMICFDVCAILGLYFDHFPILIVVDSWVVSLRVVRGHRKTAFVSTERIYEFHTLKTNHSSHTSLNAFVMICFDVCVRSFPYSYSCGQLGCLDESCSRTSESRLCFNRKDI